MRAPIVPFDSPHRIARIPVDARLRGRTEVEDDAEVLYVERWGPDAFAIFGGDGRSASTTSDGLILPIAALPRILAVLGADPSTAVTS